MNHQELQLRLLRDKVEVLEAKVSHEGNSAIDAINEMAVRINQMIENQNTEVLSKIDTKLSESFENINDAYSNLIKNSLVLEETVDALIKLLLLNKDLSTEDDEHIKEVLANFLIRNNNDEID